MAPSGPRIDTRLVSAVERLDDRSVSIAETYRRVGVVAQALGLVRPSYEQVRVLIHAARERGRRPTAGDVLLDIAFRTRAPGAIGDGFAGTLDDHDRR